MRSRPIEFIFDCFCVCLPFFVIWLVKRISGPVRKNNAFYATFFGGLKILNCFVDCHALPRLRRCVDIRDTFVVRHCDSLGRHVDADLSVAAFVDFPAAGQQFPHAFVKRV